MTIDWTSLVLGIVLGSCVTSALIWYQRGTRQPAGETGYFARVAMSVVLTAIFAGVVISVIGSMMGAAQISAGPFFGTGWLIGGLVAGWFISAPMRRK